MQSAQAPPQSGQARQVRLTGVRSRHCRPLAHRDLVVSSRSARPPEMTATTKAEGRKAKMAGLSGRGVRPPRQPRFESEHDGEPSNPHHGRRSIRRGVCWRNAARCTLRRASYRRSGCNPAAASPEAWPRITAAVTSVTSSNTSRSRAAGWANCRAAGVAHGPDIVRALFAEFCVEAGQIAAYLCARR